VALVLKRFRDSPLDLDAHGPGRLDRIGEGLLYLWRGPPLDDVQRGPGEGRAI
jgi:hypothetical protein